MKGIKLKAVRVGRKSVLLGGTAVAVVGLSMLGGVAHAGVGSAPGQLALSPASGTLTQVPTWTTSTACPAGDNFATLNLVASDSTASAPDFDIVSPTVSGTTPITNGTFSSGNTDAADWEAIGGYAAGQTAELFVQCSTGGGDTGTQSNVQSIFVTFSSTGYTTSATGPAGPVTPTVVLTAQPSTVQVGGQVTLTASVTANSTPVTTGTVTFEENGTAINSTGAAVSNGSASINTSFATAGSDQLTAVYNSANTGSIANATSAAVTETVSASNPNSASELITVSVPPSGSFTFSGTANASAPLTVSGSSATGTLVPVTVTDTRTGLAPQSSPASLANGFNGYPGWSVVGQMGALTDPTSTPVGNISGNQLGWAPAAASGDYTAGSAVTAAGPGLGTTAATLASAATGHGDGTFSLGAGLTLAIPSSAPAGNYSGTLTLTANPLANFS